MSGAMLRASDPVVLPGSNNPDMTDQVCGIALRRRAFAWWWIAHRAVPALLTCVLVGVDPLALLRRRRHLGHRLAGRLGLRHHQLCLVDRDRQRRHVHLGAVLPDAVGVAQLDQPHRRIDDAVRRRLRRHLSRSCISAGRGSSTGCSPIPNTMGLWPQFRSPLLWDFFAILTYVMASVLFWYLGLLPDLATMRDRAPTRGRQIFYGVLALGFRGSARQWRHYHATYGVLAAIMAPLVVLGAQHRRARFRRRRHGRAGIRRSFRPSSSSAPSCPASRWCCC